MMKLKRNITAIICCMVMVVAALTSAASYGMASGMKADNGLKSDTYIAAIEKTGFFDRLVDQKISIIEENTYKKLKYYVDDNVKITFKSEVIKITDIVKHSIVKLIISDGAVVEIILIQEAS